MRWQGTGAGYFAWGSELQFALRESRNSTRRFTTNHAARTSFTSGTRASGTGRIGTPGDIASAVEFLISPQASFITGTDLLVDGGAVAAMRYTR